MKYGSVEQVPPNSIHELELRAKVSIWSGVVGAYVRAYNIGGLARSLERDQLFQHARQMLVDEQAALDKLLRGVDIDQGVIDAAPHSTATSVVVKFPRLW